MLPDKPVSQLPAATLPLSGSETAILNQGGRTCTAPIGNFPPLVTITVTGDIIGSGPAGGLSLTLPNVNSNVGTFNSLAINAKGQVLSASNVNTALSGDISGSGIGSIITTISGHAVTNSKLAQMAAGTYKVNPTASTADAQDARIPAVGNCQLQRASSTQVTLMPKNGNQVVFPNGYVYAVPAAGLASGSIIGGCNLNGTAASTLSALTLYYCYLWYNNGAPALDFSVTGHATDATTGIEIKSGDATRVLIGMVYPQTGPVVTDSVTSRLVASWFNRQPKYLTNSFAANRSITNNSSAEVNSEIQVTFLSWGDAIAASSNHSGYNSGIGNIITNYIGLDGTGTFIASSSFTQLTSQSYLSNLSCAGYYSPVEGKHYLTIGGSVSAGVGTWNTGSLQAKLMI